MKNPSFAVLTAGAALVMAAPSSAASPIQVIQPGDNVMSCSALAAEINALSAQMAKAEQRAASSETLKSLGAAGLRMATPMLDTVVSESGGGTMAAAVMARSALQGAGGGRPTRAATPPQRLEEMRLQRLTGIHAAKAC